MVEPVSKRRRLFPFWLRLAVYAVLAYCALYVASEAKSRRMHEQREKARALQAEGIQQPIPLAP